MSRSDDAVVAVIVPAVLATGFVMGSSTLPTCRELLPREPWNERLPLHEDGEWPL